MNPDPNPNPSKETSRSPWMLPGRKSTGRFPDMGGHQKGIYLWMTGEDAPFRKGQKILGRFVIMEQIGQGGMSVVYRAWDDNRREDVALKCLNPTLLIHPAAEKRFMKEAGISIQLHHPAILKVYDVHTYQGFHFLSMELLDGINLREQQSLWKTQGNAPEAGRIVEIIATVAQALAYAHEFTVHKDVKPENIGIRRDGNVFLMDFGLAEILKPGSSPSYRESIGNFRVGTPYYMAPEQLGQDGLGDALSDQFSLAVVAYECLTGEVPLGLSEPLKKRMPWLPLALSATIDRALSKNREDRFASMRDFEQALRQSQGASPSLRGWVYARKRELKWGGSILLTVLAALGFWLAARSVEEWQANKSAFAERSRAILSQNEVEINRFASGIRENQLRIEWLGKELEIESMAWEKGLQGVSQWQNLISLSNQFMEATHVWNGLSQVLTPSGIPIEMSTLMDVARLESPDWKMEDLPQIAAGLSNEIHSSKARLKAVEESTRSHYLLSRYREDFSLLLEGDTLPEAMRSSFEAAWDRLGLDGKSDARESSESLPQILDGAGGFLKAAALSIVERGEQALSDWNAVFGEVGAPDLHFIANPAEELSRSRFLLGEENHAAAVQLGLAAGNRLEQWIKAVRDARARSESSWSRIADEDKVETDFGMRLVRVNGNVFCSIWETRVMDLARWVQEDPSHDITTGEFWKNPGYTQGPTHPAVGIDQETVRLFNHWVAHRFKYRFSPSGRLPTADEWTRHIPGDAASRVVTGVYPNTQEWNSDHYMKWYGDPQLDPGRLVQPTGMGRPNRLGLFDTHGNVWEWCSDLMNLGDKLNDPKTERTWVFTGGHPHRNASYHGTPPPIPNSVYVVAKHQIGFRTWITLSPVY